MRNGSQICTRCIKQPQVGYATLFAPERVIRNIIAQMQSFKITIISREAQHAGGQPQDENSVENSAMAARSANAPSPTASETDRFADAGGIEAAPGFRHFLGRPSASQRFRVFDVDPLDSPAHLKEVRALMNRLSRRMDAEIYWPSQQGSALEHWENPSNSLGLHLFAAIHCPRSGALRHTAVDLGKTGRRHGECASRAASAGKPLRQRTGGVAAHLRARCSQ